MRWLLGFLVLSSLLLAAKVLQVGENETLRLPAGYPPEVASWFSGRADFQPGGYKEKIDLFRRTTSFRAGRREPLSDLAVFEWIKEVVKYARRKGIGIAHEFSMWSDLTGFLRA
jgi:hypothetical protein